jgi:hypothetical protein
MESAIERTFKVADSDARIPRDRQARLTLLRRGLIPWLAGIDPDTKAPRRRVARLSEIPAGARPLIDLLVDQHLLSTDVARDTGEKTIEPVHEALLRQWGLLRGWLSEDAELLRVLANLQNAARDWATNGRAGAWLVHSGERLEEVRSLQNRKGYSASLGSVETEYIEACRVNEAQQEEFRREKLTLEVNQLRRYEIIVGSFLGALAGLLGMMIESSGVISMGGLLQPMRDGFGLQVGADLRGIITGGVLVAITRRQIPMSTTKTALTLILACLAHETTTYFDDFIRDEIGTSREKWNAQIVQPLVSVSGLSGLAVFALLLGATGLVRAFLLSLIPIYRRPFPLRWLAFLTFVGCAVGATRILSSGFDIWKVLGDFVGFTPALWFTNLVATTGEIAGLGWESVIGGVLAYAQSSDPASRLRQVQD